MIDPTGVTQEIRIDPTVDLSAYVGPDPVVVDEDGHPAGGPWWRRVATRLWWSVRGRALLGWWWTAHAPVNWWRLARVAPRGVAMLARGLARFVTVAEVRLLQQQLAFTPGVDKHEDARYARMDELRTVKRRWRAAAVLAVLAGLVVAGMYVYRHWPEALAVASFAGLLLGPPALGALMVRPGDVVDHPHPEVEGRPNGELVAFWFETAGITKEWPAVLDCDPIRDNAAGGFIVRVWLPRGTTTAKVRARWDELVSAVQVNRRLLHMDDLDDQGKAENLIELFIADVDPMAVPAPEWPLARVTEWDLFRPFTVGWDARRRPVRVSLLWLHCLVAGIMQTGKSTAMRTIVTAAALDPRVVLAVFDLKGSHDWLPFEARAARFEVDPLTAVHQFSEYLVWLETEMRRRYGIVRARNEKWGPGLARELRPIVVAIDEIHEALEHPGLGKIIAKQMQDLMRLCPAVGVIIVASTQKPDEKSLPPEIRSLFRLRVALSVSTWRDSEAILGEAPGHRGLNAAALGGRPGVAVVRAQATASHGEVAVVARLADVTPGLAVEVLGRVGGLAVEGSAEAARVDAGIVSLVLGAWPEGRDRVHTAELAAALGMSQVVLRDRLAAVGVGQRGSVSVGGRNGVGFRLEDVRG